VVTLFLQHPTNSKGQVASTGESKLIEKGELGGIWDEMVITYYKKLSQHLTG
jgi:hypothetical protein